MADDFGIEIDDIDFQNVFDAKRLSDVAEVALDRVKESHEERLGAGYDPDGNPLPELSERYAEYKTGRGRNDIRDLNLEGNMLPGSNVNTIPSGAEYGFNASQVAKARGNEDTIKRKGGKGFHYLSDHDIQIAEEAFSDMLDEGLKDVVKIKRRR